MLTLTVCPFNLSFHVNNVYDTCFLENALQSCQSWQLDSCSHPLFAVFTAGTNNR